VDAALGGGVRLGARVGDGVAIGIGVDEIVKTVIVRIGGCFQGTSCC